MSTSFLADSVSLPGSQQTRAGRGLLSSAQALLCRGMKGLGQDLGGPRPYEQDSPQMPEERKLRRAGHSVGGRGKGLTSTGPEAGNSSHPPEENAVWS